MKKKYRKKKTYPAYKLFCASTDSCLSERFRRFASRTQSCFVDATGQDIFAVLCATTAYLYILDFETYQTIRAALDEKYETHQRKPLICIAGPKPFISPLNVSDWIYVWEFLPDEELLALLNKSRSRIRA